MRYISMGQVLQLHSRYGLSVVGDIPAGLPHVDWTRFRGADWRGHLHRARQYRDVARALAARRLRRAAPLRLLRWLPRRIR